MRKGILKALILTAALFTGGCGISKTDPGYDTSAQDSVNVLFSDSAGNSADDTQKSADSSEINMDRVNEVLSSDPEDMDSSAEKELAETDYSEDIGKLSLEQKIAQLFFVTPEALTGVDPTTQAGDTFKAAFKSRPVGGIIFFEKNLVDATQTTEMLKTLTETSNETLSLPVWLGLDEEGGTVVRIAGQSGFECGNVGDMKDVGDTGDPQQAYYASAEIGAYLHQLGFNLNFAPVADVLTNPENTVVAKRAFGSDASMVSDMVVKAVEGFRDMDITPVLKHFPGHGSTAEDSHYSSAVSDRTANEFEECDYLPFKAGIDAGARMVMVGHICTPNLTDSSLPASISYDIVTGQLRESLKYNGVVITDGMDMAAITETYEPQDAAIAALQAGVDVILMPSDFDRAYEGVLKAVKDGVITEERIDESLQRIFRCKKE